MKENIWTYWETKPGSFRPAYLDLCEETWRRHCGDDFEIRRVTPETVAAYAPDLIEAWHHLPVPAHKADYLRAVLLHRHGGIWLDADIIVLRNLKEMIDRMRASGSDFVGIGRPGNRPSNGILCARAGCVLLDDYIRQMDQFLLDRSGDYRMSWTAIGYQLLWPLTKSYRYFQYPFRFGHPIPPARYPTFFRDHAIDQLPREDCDLRDDTLTVYLYNAMFPLWFKRMSCDAVLKSPKVISQLFHKALGMQADELFDQIRSITNRRQIPGLLKRAGLTKRVCELGVSRGHHLHSLVQITNPDLAVGIDPWSDDGVPTRNDVAVPDAHFKMMEQSVRERFAQHGDRVRLIKGYSFEHAADFPDNYFDLVYIDADHSYEAVRRDIADWYPKVRPGGILAGHDYVERNMPRVTYGVIQAVDEFVRNAGIKKFATTQERFKTWMIVKEGFVRRPTYCYWTIAFGNPRFQAEARSMIRSARLAGVNAEFHIWTDDKAAIGDAVLHRFDRRKHLAKNYMFKLEVLKAMQEFEYDYYVYLDTDNYFVRAPDADRMLRLANPLHLSQCSPINSPDYSDDYRAKAHWRGVTLQQLTDAFRTRDIEDKPLYAANAGFFVVQRSGFQAVYDACWEGFRLLHDQCAFTSAIDEFAFTFAMAKLSHPDQHLMARSDVSDLWCTDRGCYVGRLPDGKPFVYNSNWDGRRIRVNPAIVHARKSKPQLEHFGRSP